MALKLTPAHIAELRTKLAPFLTKDTAEVYHDAGLSEMRHRWDSLWSACKHTPELNETIREIYGYADDTHLDSVLRLLQRENNACAPSKTP